MIKFLFLDAFTSVGAEEMCRSTVSAGYGTITKMVKPKPRSSISSRRFAKNLDHAGNDSSRQKKAAIDMVTNIQKACDSLSKNPERGHTPTELLQITQFEYRQIIENKYRIIYQLVKPNIFVFGIIHGSRNLGEVLRQRMLL